MECNKDEAVRAKEIAEKKFNAKDISGAKKFAQKALNLHPGLEGIPQMLATFDVYLSAENKINGENDWYSVLSVNANADEETVRKQYRKLALTLHPDKNKSIGAEGAFKLLSEAWSVLSDKGRRSLYDQKTKMRKHQQRASRSGRDTSTPDSNGFCNYESKSSSNARNQKTSRCSNPSAPSHHANPDTFWTACSWCKMQYEYLRVYLNHNLLCPNCHEPFLAVEMASPANGFHSTPWPSYQMHLNHNMSNHSGYASGRSSCMGPKAGSASYSHGVGYDSSNATSFHWGPFSRGAGVASATASTAAAVKAANVVHDTYEKVRRAREEAQTVARREERKKCLSAKRDRSSYVNGSSGNNVASLNVENPLKKKKSVDDTDDVGNAGNLGSGANVDAPNGVAINGIPRRATNYDWIRELSSHDVRGMLLYKSRNSLIKKLADMNAKMGKGKRDMTPSVDQYEEVKLEKMIYKKNEDHNISCDDSVVYPAIEETKYASINVPDPDFHDFDHDRQEASFEANQVWAAYDDDDGMPRFYALIHKVISLKPFKMQFSWLNSKSNSELGPLNWVASGFSKICGEFRVGRYEISNTVNVFSHRVKWEKGVRGVVRIFPRKTEVWALYRNWSPEWNETTPDDVIHKYDMVEVLEDFNEEGVLVTPLVKVAGFKTVFHRHMDPLEVKRIRREEMFRFSHQVPSLLLTGEEAPNAPKGCRELDPAATPLELLRVITETKEENENENKRERIEDDSVVGNNEVANGAERKEDIAVVDDNGIANAKEGRDAVVLDSPNLEI